MDYKAKIKKALHFLASVLMYSVLLLMLLILVTVIVYVIEDKSNTEHDHYTAPIFSAYIIISPSMEPAILVNDAVIDIRTLPGLIKVGDVITFVSSDPLAYGKTITHRVTGIEQDAQGKYLFRTKGDANNTEDSTLVMESHLLGKVMFKIPKLGYIQNFLATSYGWIIAIVLPCLVIIIYDIVKLTATLIRSRKKKPTDDTDDKKKIDNPEMSSNKDSSSGGGRDDEII